MAKQAFESKPAPLMKPDRWEDPRQRTRVVPMEVLSLGLPRTGTSSIQAALEILGISPVCHATDVITQTLDLEMAVEGITAKFRPASTSTKPFSRNEFDQLLGNYRAVTDTPYCHFGPELVTAYPDAKVILVERDMESWYQSFSSTVAAAILKGAPPPGGAKPDPAMMRRGLLLKKSFFTAWGCEPTDSPDEIRAKVCARFRAHYAEVRSAARPGQILEFRLSDGWEPLCKFLDKPVPNVPFPRKNDKVEFWKQREDGRRKVVRAAQGLAVGVGILAAGAAMFFWVARSRQWGSLPAL